MAVILVAGLIVALIVTTFWREIFALLFLGSLTLIFAGVLAVMDSSRSMFGS